MLRNRHAEQIGLALERVHAAECALIRALDDLRHRHPNDHEVFHVARDVAAWSRRHVPLVAEAAGAWGRDLDPEGPAEDSSVRDRLAERAAQLVGRRHAASVLLLDDLRAAHLCAAGASLDWEVLAQAAQALRDDALLALVQECHPQTLRQLRWTNAQVKETSAQIVVAGAGS
ncbi:hypothetical protein K8Z61_13590 [Nocardioides sp. TRM66260-LWL]|uniref:hypothetical protein n=1 Tax=Nocardioides sp. TRM66260-LWL TaxID=2874478 RepID=UPI001CC47215|nr:hypothetical protein [Nocardioides sp. TRM66260-LWL]MBZ5735527.1 hypothetical protein [Nocardioides sp. TRM66260-LWL]